MQDTWLRVSIDISNYGDKLNEWRILNVLSSFVSSLLSRVDTALDRGFVDSNLDSIHSRFARRIWRVILVEVDTLNTRDSIEKKCNQRESQLEYRSNLRHE